MAIIIIIMANNNNNENNEIRIMKIMAKENQ